MIIRVLRVDILMNYNFIYLYKSTIIINKMC